MIYFLAIDVCRLIYCSGIQYIAYFEEWTEELIDSGVFDNGVSTELFLSWQVLLRNADTFGPVKCPESRVNIKKSPV